MQAHTYNGWSNYETWLANTWIHDTEGTSRYWQEQARECWHRADNAVLALSDQLHAEHEEDRPDLGASVWSDMLDAALAEVNWLEIAQALIDDAADADADADADAA